MIINDFYTLTPSLKVRRGHTVPEWAESLKNSSLSKSGFVLKSTLLGSRISRSHQNLMRAFRENHKKVDF